MAVDDWIANLFQSEQTRGLSGGLSAAVTVDESNPFYNYRLQRHQVQGIWFPNPYCCGPVVVLRMRVVDCRNIC